jgi:hypothetical protein
MQGAFDSDHVSKNFLLERKLPSGETKGLVTEDEPIPFIPNAPSSNHKNFHEEKGEERLVCPSKSSDENCWNCSKRFPTQTTYKQQQNTQRTDAQKSPQSPHGIKHSYILPQGLFAFFSECFSYSVCHSEGAKQRILLWEYNLISKPKGSPY